jgi:coatomer subunit beta
MREAAQKFPTLTGTITEKLLEIFPQIKSAKVMRFTLWILGEFVNNREDVQNVMTQVRACLGQLPLTESELKKAAWGRE